MAHEKPNLKPEMIEQEVRRYYLDEDGQVHARTEVIKVPTGRLIPANPDAESTSQE